MDQRNEADAEERVVQRVRDEVLLIVLNDVHRPLHEISFNVDVIERGAGDILRTNAPLREAVDDIRQALARVSALLSALTEFGHVVGAQTTLDVRSHSVSTMTTVVVNAVRPLVYARKARVVVDVGDVGQRVRCDRGRMVLALAALVVEAVRQTPAGGCVRLSVTHAAGACFTVKTEGPRLDAEQVASLFAAPAQDQGAAPPFGMRTARRMVELHGGTLTACPDPSGGMLFRAALPASPG